MNRKLKEKIISLRKQKFHCDVCGKPLYRPYIRGTKIFCYKHAKEYDENKISPNQITIFGEIFRELKKVERKQLTN